MSARRYDHVVFDLDGTLVDSRADLADSVKHVLAESGLAPLPFDTVCSYIGEGARRLVQRALGATNESRLDEVLAAFLRYYGEHLLDHTNLYPGVAAALEELRALGAVLSVLTNKPEAMSRAILDGLGVSAHFTAVLGGDSLAVRKPAPAGLLRLSELSSVPLSRTLLVGDSRVDVETAQAAGVAFCGVLWGIQPDQLRTAGAANLVAHPRDLVRLIAGHHSVRTGYF